MNVSRKTTFAAGAIMALILGSGTAYAATGGNFRLGEANTATHMVIPAGSPLARCRATIVYGVCRRPARLCS